MTTILLATTPTLTGHNLIWTVQHYLLTEARESPTDKPLALWQQGGPGSSGMAFGWLAELGPYTGC